MILKAPSNPIANGVPQILPAMESMDNSPIFKKKQSHYMINDHINIYIYIIYIYIYIYIYIQQPY